MGKPRHVLLVDDNPVAADVLQFYLERVAGCTVSVAANGAEALARLRQERVELIVTDYCMPGMDGRELCEAIRGMAGYEQTPIMLVTAHRAVLDVAELRSEFGVLEVFPKPFSPTELVRAIHRYFAPKEAQTVP